MAGMSRTSQLEEGRTGIDLIEEAFHLLRSTPASVLLLYYIGAAPFVLGLLYFWSDMSQSAFAPGRLGPASLAMVLLYFWAKVWQSIFAQRLLSRRSRSLAKTNEASRAMTPRGIWQMLRAQAAIHATGLFLWPLALALLLPFGWVNAFYQSATVLGVARDGTLRSLVRQALSQSRLWVVHNHVFLLVWKGFWIFVWLNWISAAMVLPFLARTFLGIESPFTKSPAAMLNSTFFAVVTALMYLSTDPLHKAVYVLRCFHGESLRSGRDLQAELNELNAGRGLARVASIALGAALILFAGSPSITAAPNEISPSSEPFHQGPLLPAARLDRSITETLQQHEYSWRLPRSETKRDVGLIEGFIAGIGETIAQWTKTVGRWLSAALDKIANFIRPPVSIGSPGMGWIVAVRTIGFVLLVVMVFFLVMYIFRLWLKNRRTSNDGVMATPMPELLDLSDQSIGADQLPEDEWIKLGSDLLARGERRLAMRAYYLASLAHLAGRNLITLARHKSNYEYGRELRRRAHALPAVMQSFDENVTVFDRSWYGAHAIDEMILSRFESNVRRIKAE